MANRADTEAPLSPKHVPASALDAPESLADIMQATLTLQLEYVGSMSWHLGAPSINKLIFQDDNGGLRKRYIMLMPTTIMDCTYV